MEIIFYIPGTLFLALDADRTALFGIGKAEGTNAFTISFPNNSGGINSCGLKCLSQIKQFTVNCKPNIELHLFTHSYKISNNNFIKRISTIILKQYL